MQITAIQQSTLVTRAAPGRSQYHQKKWQLGESGRSSNRQVGLRPGADLMVQGLKSAQAYVAPTSFSQLR
jgi:hypothetical protein